jgi:hypothetical protein
MRHIFGEFWIHASPTRATKSAMNRVAQSANMEHYVHNYYLSSLFVHLYGASSSHQQFYDFWLILLVILATGSTVCFVLSFSYAGFPGFQADYIHWKSIGQMCGPGFTIDTIVVAWHPWLVIGNSNVLLC